MNKLNNFLLFNNNKLIIKIKSKIGQESKQGLKEDIKESKKEEIEK